MKEVTTYLITRDLIPTLERVYRKNLDNGQRADIADLESKFLEEFWKYIPSDVRKEELQYDEIAGLLDFAISREELPIISIDRTYIDLDTVDGEFSATRLYNPKTGKTKLAARPGEIPLEEQAQNIAEKYRKITLVDIGAFEGETIEEILEILNSAGVNVSKVYLGTWGTQAIEKLEGKVPVLAMKTYNFYEWIELRDFFGLDGRKTADGGFVPYWEKPEEWANIPEENAQSVAELCRKYNRELMEVLRC